VFFIHINRNKVGMPVMSMANNTYALRVRLQHSRTLYSGDCTRDTSTSCRSASLLTTPQVQYGTRLLDLNLGRLVCCQASGVSETRCGCGGAPRGNLPTV